MRVDECDHLSCPPDSIKLHMERSQQKTYRTTCPTRKSQIVPKVLNVRIKGITWQMAEVFVEVKTEQVRQVTILGNSH